MKTKFYRTPTANRPGYLHNNQGPGDSPSTQRRKDAQRWLYYNANPGDTVELSNGDRYWVDDDGSWHTK